MNKRFSEEQYQFILNNCSTDEQRNSLIRIRAFCKEHFYEYTGTRCICFDTAKTSRVALIRLESRRNPEVIIKLPHITKYQNISQKQSSRYGFEIEEDGSITNSVNQYLVKNFTKKGKTSLNRITDVLLKEQKLSDNLNNLIQLIKHLTSTY